MKKKFIAIISVFAAVLLVSVFAGCYKSKTIGYRLYVGTNDKDTYRLEVPLEQQKEKLLNIITAYTDGVTIYETCGYWKDETGSITSETTFVCEFLDLSKETLEKISADVLKELNQNSVLYTEIKDQPVFLSGEDLLK